MSIRPVASPSLEPAGCRFVWQSSFPYRDYDADRTSRLVSDRKLLLYVATEDDDIVGFGTLGGLATAGRMVRTAVHPDHRHRGIGSALLEELLSHVPAGVPVSSAIPVTEARSVAFAERYGFEVDGDCEDDELELVRRGPWTDEAPDGRVVALGRWDSLSDLVPLVAAAAEALPNDDNLPREQDPVPFLRSLDQERSAVAVVEGAVRGFTLVRQEPRSSHVVMTYVDPGHRRRGLARALKSHTLRHTDPKAWVTTECRRGNSGILALNLALGFEDVSLRIVTRPVP